VWGHLKIPFDRIISWVFSSVNISKMKWFVYIVRGKDDSLYTGITTNISRRIREHNNKTGAKSLKGKLPVKLVYQEEYTNQREAAERERNIKSWTRKYKLKLILNNKGNL